MSGAPAAAPPRRGGKAAPMVLPAMALLLPPTALFAANGLVPLGLAATLALIVGPGRAAVLREAAAVARSGVVVALTALLAWMLAAAAWSPAPGAFALWLSLTILSGAGLILVAAARTLDDSAAARLERALCGGGALFLGLALLETTAGHPVSRQFHPAGPLLAETLGRGAAVLAGSLWLYAAAAQHRLGGLPALAATVLLGLAALAAMPMFAALVAAGVGAAVYAATRARPRPALFALGAILVIAILAAPFLALLPGDPEAIARAVPSLPQSWLHRLYIWQFAGLKALEAPLWGWGLDASRAIPGGDRLVFGEVAMALPLHPHSAALQVWLELGLIGALLAAGVVIALLRAVAAAAPRAACAAAAATMATHLVIALLSYGVWQNWWYMVPWLLAAQLAGGPWRAPGR